MTYWETFVHGFWGYARYLAHEVFNPHWSNYFYWLIAISAAVYALELMFPWRKNQPAIREDFWLDTFYMFFNFFLFGLVGYAALSDVVVRAFNDFLASTFGIRNLVAINVAELPRWAQLLILFVVRDFVQWNTHRLLHRVPFLWEVHKVHHSVRQMGYAAHLRYHFGETIVYRSIEYMPLAMIGFGIQDFILVHLFTIAVGHLNHANLRLPLGPLKYLLNNPQMHIWHHAKHLPKGSYGINYGITLSLWDYLFGTDYMPHDGRDIPLGFEEVDRYPHGFFDQMLQPFRKK
ncbi:MAG TPA: sterol desaturase family protein [Saprospiraceae bacterium]|nr:sterol desaturase family protein [Saprospiraceae bacterium]HND88648.1 sterol desaturase family protein [Saprospiraceae bacterium]HNG89983.1 sterol desaturase family protein [Saprospiraceae bacterium]